MNESVPSKSSSSVVLSRKAESIGTPSRNTFSLTSAEHQHEARQMEKDSRDPNFDRNNPTLSSSVSNDRNEEEDKKQEKEDVSFATTSSQNKVKENKTRTSKEEYTVDKLASGQDPNFDNDDPTSSISSSPVLIKITSMKAESIKVQSRKDSSIDRIANFDRDNPTSSVSPSVK